MKKENKGYILVFVCIGILVALIGLLLPKGYDDVDGVVVNPENGDIAFCYIDRTSNLPMLTVSLYTKDGEERFTKRIVNSVKSATSIAFFEGKLYVTHFDKFFCLDMEGNKLDEMRISSEDEEKLLLSQFDLWGWSEYCTLGEYRYCREFASIFRRGTRLIIEHGDKTTVIYQSP